MPPRPPRALPAIVRVLRGEGADLHSSPTGSVGRIYRGSGFEVVWVRKQAEAIDPAWFSQPMVDVLLVLQGKLRVEFQRPRRAKVIGPGDVLVLPPGRRCRAYRWPRTARRATIFVAVYPLRAGARHSRRTRPPVREPS